MKAHCRSRRAFSLVETVLAVGLASTAALVLFSLMPAGLGALRQAANATADARILQAVASEYQMRPWEDILRRQSTNGGETFYFDAQGMQVEKNARDLTFTARATILPDQTLPGAPEPNERLKTVEILVASGPNAAALFEKAATHSNACRRFCLSVAQTDKAP